MLDENEINAEISRLEYEESSYPNYGKLAVLYTIRNQMKKQPSYDMDYSAAPPPVTTGQTIIGDSDFLRIAGEKDPNEVWLVIDDLMDTLSVTNRRVYDSIMRRIDAL